MHRLGGLEVCCMLTIHQQWSAGMVLSVVGRLAVTFFGHHLDRTVPEIAGAVLWCKNESKLQSITVSRDRLGIQGSTNARGTVISVSYLCTGLRHVSTPQHMCSWFTECVGRECWKRTTTLLERIHLRVRIACLCSASIAISVRCSLSACRWAALFREPSAAANCNNTHTAFRRSHHQQDVDDVSVRSPWKLRISIAMVNVYVVNVSQKDCIQFWRAIHRQRILNSR